MKNHFISCTLGILSFFFIPYFFIIPLNGIDTLMINQKFNVERILPVVTAIQIDKNMKLETIKAQTIIARSDYYRRLEEKESLLDILKGLRRDLEKKSFSEWILDEKYERAAEETRGEVLHSRLVDPEIRTLVKGLMIESYIEPGNQKIGCDHIYGKSITDPCLGWEESEKLLYTIAEMC